MVSLAYWSTSDGGWSMPGRQETPDRTWRSVRYSGGRERPVCLWRPSSPARDAEIAEGVAAARARMGGV